MKKRSFLIGALCGALTVLLVGIVVLQGIKGHKVVDSGVETKLNYVKALIQSKYLYEDEIDERVLRDSLIKGYVAGLGDPYSVYYDEAETKELLETTSGEFEGIGVVLQQDIETRFITFVTVYEGSPAEKGGFKSGDLLYKVNGEDVSVQDLDKVVAKVRGKKGTTVELTVLRGEKAEEVTATLTRDTVEVQTVDWELKEGQIGYIQIAQFDTVTYGQFEKALTELTSKGAKGFVFDVRNNPGGNLDTVCDILDLILPEGTIVYTENKEAKKEVISSDEERQIELPMAVLINENSASASEIFAGAIKDYKLGTLVGKTTYGKGIVQQLFPMTDGTCLKLTISEYFTPNGNSIHEKGVEPDVEVEYTESDNQLEKACEIIRNEVEK